MIVVEKGQSGAPMVAWLSHAGTLIRVALEHLRMATPLESRTFDVLSDVGLLRSKDMKGSRYIDLGVVPTPAEERRASHMQTDEPPAPPPLTPRALGMSSGAQPVRSVAPTTAVASSDSSSSSTTSSSSESEPENAQMPVASQRPQSLGPQSQSSPSQPSQPLPS